MTAANIVTFSRIALIPLFIFFLFFHAGTLFRNIAVALFVILALGDVLDGFLARKFNQVSDTGKFLDPIADKFLVFSAYLVLVELGEISSIPVLLILGRELAVMGVRIAAASRGNIIAATYWSKWKTVFQMIAAVMIMLSLPYSMPVLWLAVIITLVSGVEYLRYVGRN